MTSLFGGGSSINVNASGTLVPQVLTPVDSQTVFPLTLFTYTPNTNSLLVFINGTLQNLGTDYSETSSSSFTLTAPVLATDSVKVIGFPLATFFQAGVGNSLTDIPTVAVVQAGAYAWLGTTTGSANAQVGTPTAVPPALTAGMVFRFIAGFANTGALTLQIGTLGAKAVTKSAATALALGDITVGAAYQVVYDGTQFQLSGGVGGSGGGATGGGTDKVFFENDMTVSSDYTLTAGKNAMTAGPVTIATGVTVTIPTGATWSIV